MIILFQYPVNVMSLRSDGNGRLLLRKKMALSTRARIFSAESTGEMQAPDSYCAGQCSIGPIDSPAGGALSVIFTK